MNCDNVYISEIGSMEIRLRQHVGNGKLNSKLVQPASETYHTPSFKNSLVLKVIAAFIIINYSLKIGLLTYTLTRSMNLV